MNLSKLATLVRLEREGLLLRWRQEVRKLPSAQGLDTPTLNDHIPGLLDELAEALDSNSRQTIPEALVEDSAQVHGLQRLRDAFDIEEVVAEYNILRGGIHDLANDNGISLQGRPFHVINRVFDGAIGVALQTYATQRALEVQKRREEYLAFVAHDLGTPLFAISLAERVLERTLPKRGYTADSAQMLKTLRRSVQQLEGLVRKVLDENANLQTEAGIKLQRRDFDLWPLVESLMEELQPLAQAAGTRLVNSVPDDLVGFADASLLKRIFQNLIANAIRYTPGGEVVVAALAPAEEEVIRFTVSDNGAGIASELLDCVFNKGETDAASDDSTGLGLAIVRKFTEAHGGKVEVASTLGKGSTFTFFLPLRGEQK
jgi:two-component system, OmpR family, phosphate regulon sensor histidine kinase PhoR